MATNIKITAGLAAPLCAAVLLATLCEAMVAAPARAEDSLFSAPVAAPTVESPAPTAAPVVKPKPKPKKLVKRKPAPKPDAAAATQPATLPPVVVQERAPENQTGFAQPMPSQYLLNKMFSPASTGQGANGGSGANGAADPAQQPEEETLPNGMPRKFLLNRLFNSSALEPSWQQPSRSRNPPDPRSFMAQATPSQPPAQPTQPSWFDQATGALGFGAKPQDQTTNLPPVNVTAPANPVATPAKPAKATAKPAAPSPAPAPAALAPPPPPREPNWFDRATNAMGIDKGNEAIPDYSERPKLVLPPNRNALPNPNPVDERTVSRPPSQEALTRPPASFTEKVQGADGKVSGFTDQDQGKKGWFNWF